MAAAAFVRPAAARPATGLVVGGTGAAFGTIRRLVAAFVADNPQVQAEVPNSLGTTGGMRAVLAGAIDVAVGVRPVNAEEAAAGARSVLFGRSPFGFVTSHAAPPADLTTQALIEIYSLNRRNWSDGTQLRVILRTRRDGDSLFLTERFPALESVLDETHARKLLPVAQTDQVNLDMAEKLEGSFASSTIAAVVSEERKLRIVALDGVTPSLESIASGAYPHVRPLHLVTMPTTSEAGHAFVAFVLSARARDILVRCCTAPAAG